MGYFLEKYAKSIICLEVGYLSTNLKSDFLKSSVIYKKKPREIKSACCCDKKNTYFTT